MIASKPASASYEEDWRKRLAEAELRYRLTVRRLAELTESLKAAPEEVVLATRQKLAARDEYRRVLRTFTDLIVRGIPPQP